MTGTTETDGWIAIGTLVIFLITLGFAVREYVDTIVQTRTSTLETKIAILESENSRLRSSI